MCYYSFHNSTAAHICVQSCADWHLPFTAALQQSRWSLRNRLQCENEITLSRLLLLINVRRCDFIHANMPRGCSVLFREFNRRRPPCAWYLFSFRASLCMASRLHTISHTLIVTNYTLKQDSSSALAACDVFHQQEQRCVQGFLRARCQVAGHNKSIMRSWGSSLRPVPRDLHPGLEMSQIHTTTALRGMWPAKNTTKNYMSCRLSDRTVVEFFGSVVRKAPIEEQKPSFSVCDGPKRL